MLDYHPLHTNSILFGFGGLAIIYIAQPSISTIIAELSSEWRLGLAIGIAVLMAIDFVMSVIANYNIRGIVENSAQQIKSTAIKFYLHPKQSREKIKSESKRENKS